MSIAPRPKLNQVFQKEAVILFHYKDQISLNLASGSGGQGCLSFYTTRKKPRGGPDGGDGGRGGSVFFISSSKANGFEPLKKIRKYCAGSGGSGGKQLKKGKQGKDVNINIPIGTLVRNEKGQILRDFISPVREIFLEGGRGGRGNAFFKTSLNQAPRQFQKGEKGQSQKVLLELKPLVHVAIVGKVNTGKSSFFNLVTKSKSKVADYPYTTLVPHIGRIKNLSEFYFIMDIPGLDKGASQTVSKGLSFLRSIQRAELLLNFIDSSSPTALRDKKDIEKELKLFDKNQSESYFKGLSRKKVFFILSKVDKFEDQTQLNQLIKKVSLKKSQKIFALSNTKKQGLKEILSAIEETLEKPSRARRSG